MDPLCMVLIIRKYQRATIPQVQDILKGILMGVRHYKFLHNIIYESFY